MNHAESRSNVLATLGVLFMVCSAARFVPSGMANAEDGAPPTPSNPANAADPQSLETAAGPESGLTSLAGPNGQPGGNATEASRQMNSGPIAQRTALPETCFTGELARMLEEDRWLFEEKEADFRDRLLSLELREQELAALEQELIGLRGSLESRWQDMQAAARADRSHLAQMYMAMKPDEAAAIMGRMETGLAAAFLRQMPSEQAGLILASMNSERAFAVSVELAERNADLLPGDGT